MGPDSAHGLDNDGLDLFLSRGSHYCAHDRGPSPRWQVLVMSSWAAAGPASQADDVPSSDVLALPAVSRSASSFG